MRQLLFSLAVLAGSLAWPHGPARAQIDPLNPVPGGATGSTAVCIQAGDLNSGAFVAIFAQTERTSWEEKRFDKPGAVRLDETKRTEEALELGGSQTLQFDFVRKKVRSAPRPGSPDWTDLYHMLNATDKEGAVDCLALASRLGAPPPAPGAAGAAGGGRPMTLIQNITVRPGTVFVVPPGTQLTATAGPPCPGQPGFFLCPNKFSCAPNGGVCCPGVGACAPGTFCDRFIPNACIGPGDPRFCPGSGDPVTGISLHCAVGSVCLPGNVCNP